MDKLLIFCVLCVSVLATGCVFDCIDDVNFGWSKKSGTTEGYERCEGDSAPNYNDISGVSPEGHVLKSADATAYFLTEEPMIEWVDMYDEDFNLEEYYGERVLLFFEEREGVQYQVSEVAGYLRDDGLEDYYFLGFDNWEEQPDKLAVIEIPDLESEDLVWATELGAELHPDDGEVVLAYDEENHGLHLREFRFDVEYTTESARPLVTTVWYEPGTDNIYEDDPDAWLYIPKPVRESLSSYATGGVE